MNRRIERIEKNLQRIIAQIIDEELQPPSLVSVMRVSCDSGLTKAHVAISIYSPGGNSATTIEYLDQRTSFIRRELAARGKMRRTPEINFLLDTSLEDGQAMIDLMSKLSSQR